MSTLNLTYTLAAGAVENINHVQQNFTDVRTWANGNVGAANLASGEITNTHVSASAAIALSKLGTAPAARVYRDSAQSIPYNTATALAFNQERFDTDTIHDNATNNSRLTCKTAGLYLITGHGEFESATGYQVQDAYVRLNGATVIGGMGTTANPTSDEFRMRKFSVAVPYVLAVGDYVELVVYHLRPDLAAKNILQVPNLSPEFAMVYQGRVA